MDGRSSRGSAPRAGTLGVVVAGGRGRRLGLDAPKAAVALAGATLLERAVALARAVGDEVVVVAPRGLALPPAGAPRVDDAPGARGPLAGVVAGLAARPHGRAVVLGVDFPLLEPAALEALLARLGDRAAVVAAPGGIPQPLAAAYGPAAAAALAAALGAGERSLTRAVLSLDPRIVAGAELERLPGGSAAFLNVNTPADLEAAAAALGARGPA